MVLFAINIETLKTLKYQIFLEKALGISTVCSKCDNEYKKLFKEE